MKRHSLILIVLCFALPLYAQQPPGTDIYLFNLSIKKTKVKVSNPQNMTNRVGYDNQPNFNPTKPLVYYASADAEGKTDIIEYNYATQKTRNITTTAEREYSPTVTPDNQFLSCIIQRDNGAQDLGKYPIEGGGEPIVLISTLTVGYHAWINSSELLMFVLGDTMTLHHFHLPLRRDDILAAGIGRSLHKIPKSNAMSFVHKISEKEWLIKRLNANGSIETIAATLPGREDLAWTPDGKILMSDGKSLFYYWPGKQESWQPIVIPSFATGTITRIAISPKGNKLAVVVSE